MRYMLDTDISSYIIKQHPQAVLSRFDAIPRGEMCISVITLAELLYGIELSRSKTLNRELVDEFTSRLSIVPWSVGAAEHYGKFAFFREKHSAYFSKFLIAEFYKLSLKTTKF